MTLQNCQDEYIYLYLFREVQEPHAVLGYSIIKSSIPHQRYKSKGTWTYTVINEQGPIWLCHYYQEEESKKKILEEQAEIIYFKNFLK